MKWMMGSFSLLLALASHGAAPQETGSFPTDSLRPTEWHVHYDSTLLKHLTLLPTPSARPLVGNLRIQPLVAGSSVLRIEAKGLPTRVYVLNNVSLQIGGYVTLSNGQAWLWSPYPNGFLDARTLSVPLP